MLLFNLHSICRARGVERPYTFLAKSGLTYSAATKLLNNNIRILRLDHIEIICEKLHCTPNDLLTWIPDKNKSFTSDHPLNRLKRDETLSTIQETLRTLPLDQLAEIADIINSRKNKKENP